MSRGADPLAIRTQAWRPYSHVSTTQRVATRQIMHGDIQDDLPKHSPFWWWVRFVIMVPVTVYALSLWLVR